MTVTRRLSAYVLSFSFGFGVPLMALAAAQDEPFPHHTSSRMITAQADPAQDDLEALRERLWALTEHGGTEHCNVEGITAPCAGVVVFDQTK